MFAKNCKNRKVNTYLQNLETDLLVELGAGNAGFKQIFMTLDSVLPESYLRLFPSHIPIILFTKTTFLCKNVFLYLPVLGKKPKTAEKVKNRPTAHFD